MKVVELSGGVGGARLARGLAAIGDVELTVIVNVGDDEMTHGLHVSPDIDTVIYTLAEEEGPEGWGRRGDTFILNSELGRFGIDNRFQLGDLDLALKLYRTVELAAGSSLSKVTADSAQAFGVAARILPGTDDALATSVLLDDGWVTFREYFVERQHRDMVHEVRFDGADSAVAAPGVVDAIRTADVVIIGPSNPPLSIWPTLAIEGVREAVEDHPAVTAVSPLIDGKTVKGPADRVLVSLGLGAGSAGVASAYRGLIDRLVVGTHDGVEIDGVEVVATDTLIKTPEASVRLAKELIDT